MRVSRKWVVFTYFDQTSLKYRLQEFRRRFNIKRPNSMVLVWRCVGFFSEA